MLSRISLILAMFLSLVAADVAMAAPAPEAAEEFIQDLGEQAVATLENDDVSMMVREDTLRTLLARGFDMPFLARLALGRNFRELNDSQQSDYEELFHDYVLKTYSRRFSGFRDIAINVTGAEELNDDDTVVHTELMSSNGPPAKVDWRIRERKDGLKIIDVVIEGVSMVITQRQEFQSIVQRNGLNGLMSVLRARSERATASSTEES